MHQLFLQLAALLGALSVILGAFAAHKLKEIFPPRAVDIFHTGVTYQFYHVFALALTGILYGSYPGRLMETAGWLFVGGMVLFSGSLYLLSYGLYSGSNLKWAGPVTPLGGLLFIAGWICLAMAIRK
jgi:uncharacterized membrane protein YgdD (TMEM256/DUF423 family)